MSCTINVIQFTSSVYPPKWVDDASLPAEPCTLHFHCCWQQPSCSHSMHLADIFPRQMSCTRNVTQLSYQHLSMHHWNVAKTDRWLQLSQVTPLHQMHDMKTTEAENYNWNLLLPTTQFPIHSIYQSNRHSCDLSVAISASLLSAYVTFKVHV